MSGSGLVDALRRWTRDRPAIEQLAHIPPDDARGLVAALDELFERGLTPARLADALRHSAEPDATALALAEALARPDPTGLDDPEALRLFCRLAGVGRYPRRTLVAHPEWPHQLHTAAAHAWPRDALRADLRRRCALPDADPDSDRIDVEGLRRARRFHTLRILTRELAGDPIASTTAAFSDLTDACIDLALAHCRHDVEREVGTLVADDGQPLSMAVLALGKLGGRELNYSSDVDLVFVYRTDAGHVVHPDGHRHPTVDVHAWHVRVGRALVQLLGATSPEGFLYRVDMRLRPGGARGPLAHAVDALVDFYESWGTTWQRAAWLKARAVAGDLALGRQVLDALEPFVFRRYLDHAALEQIAELKQRIDQQVDRRALGPLHKGRWDIKQGHGGIREVEFTVQALQLVYGGRRPELRTGNSLEAIQRLTVGGLLAHGDADTLETAYRLFRRVEHHIQIADDRQTSAVPVDDALAMALLAGRLDPSRPDGEALRQRLRDHADAVHQVFASVLPGYSTEREAGPPPAHELLARALRDGPDALDEQVLHTALHDCGLHDTDQAVGHLRVLAARPFLPVHEGERGATLRHLLLDGVLHSPDPDLALANLTLFMTRQGTRTGYLGVLLASPELARLVLMLFGTSDFLSKRLASYPELVDQLSAPGWLARTLDEAAFGRELDLRLDAISDDDTERGLNLLRRFKYEHILRIALRDIGGLATVDAVRAELSDLATVLLRAAFGLAWRETVARYGQPMLDDESTPSAMAILALGKLGGREISYASDLDLVFIYTGPGATHGGERSISLQGLYSRLTQKLISFLSTHLREGKLYVVDTRLRPSGNQGALVTSLEGYRTYLRRDAALWERQALLRARAVAGDDALGRQVEALVESFAHDARGRAPDAILAEVAQMRLRMQELARTHPEQRNVKYGAGGLVDGEFAVQLLQLIHGDAIPGLRTPSTLVALERAGTLGVVDPERARAVAESMRFLMRLEDRLRIVRDQSIHSWQARGPDLERLARRMGFAGPASDAGQALLDAWSRHTAVVHAFYGDVVDGSVG